MKRLLLSFFLLASYLAAAAFPRIRPMEYSGPYTVIAGARTMASMTPMLSFTFTVDHATNIFTSTGGYYTPRNGDIFTPDSSGMLPAGMYTIVDNVWPVYAVCDVGIGGVATFHVKQTNMSYTNPDTCTGTQLTVTDNGTGTHYGALFNASANVYLNADPTGFPTGTTFTYMYPPGASECGVSPPPSSGGKYYSPGQGAFCIVATVPSNATPGAYTTHITFCGATNGTNCTTFDWAINVIAPPNISYTPPSSFSALPGLAYWEGVMTARPCVNSACGSPGVPASSVSGPANFCDPLASPSPVNSLGAATSAGVSYYGWNLLFDNMAIYTGNSIYRTGCFQDGMGHTGTADLQSVRYYVTNNHGSMVTYAHFTESLFRACRVFNDSSYCTAGLLMQNNAQVGLGPTLGPSAFRPTVYGLDDAVALKKYGNLTTSHWTDLRDGVYSMALRATESDASGVRFPQQMFMLGLAAHAIEADWQLTGDNRAPYIIQRIADYAWAHYDKAMHKEMNLEGPDNSPWCSNGALWFVAGDGNCGIYPTNYQVDQLLMVNAFYWLFAYTGNTTYRDEGDDWFSHSFDQGYLTGKQASTSYYDSFNAVGWRTGTLKANQWYGDAQTQLALNPATCDLNGDGQVNVIDVQLGTNQALGTTSCGTGDLNGDGVCTIVDVMRIVNASLGATCSTSP